MPSPNIKSPSAPVEESKPIAKMETSGVSKATESVKVSDEFEEDADVIEALAMDPALR